MITTSTKIPASYRMLKPEIKQRAMYLATKLMEEGFEDAVSFSVAFHCAINENLYKHSKI